MESDHSHIVEALFKQAVDRNPAERAALLSEQCGSNEALRAEVESLLAHHDATGGALDRGWHAEGGLATAGGSSFLSAEPQTAARSFPARVGAYKLVDVLGEGGMGVVYRAEQDKPRRSVALKLIRPGSASAQALRRFEYEAQILGRLQHPGIAQIFEAGTALTAPGAPPYFAMELVQGEPLLGYVQARRLDMRLRLAVLAKICDAVHHAHQKGVIHRDLKPGNILVVDETERGQLRTQDSALPKILDFGVARLVDSDLQAATLRTQPGQLVGTVHYMSPEQCTGDPQEVDIRSDIYALGVIGYELLVGRLPYDLEKKTLPEVVHIIREQEPKPLGSVSRLLRGDVETILAKALEKDKNRRYQSASDLAGDLRRFLADEPILARPASNPYRLRKFARRNKALVAGIATVVVCLALGLAGTTWQALRATRQAEKAWQIQGFLQNMLATLSPEKAQGRDVTLLREMLDQTAERIDAELAAQPEVEAAIRDTMGLVYRGIGEYPTARAQLEKSLELRRQVLGEDHSETLVTVSHLGMVLLDAGQAQAAEALLDPALERADRALGQEHPATLELMNNLGSALLAQGKADQPEPLFREVLQIRTRLLGGAHRDTLIAMGNLGSMLLQQGRLADAEPQLARTLELSRSSLGDDHPDTLVSMDNLAGLFWEMGKLGEAEALSREALDRKTHVFGRNHHITLVSMNNLASMLRQQGKTGEAEPLRREVLETQRRVLGDEHPDTLSSMNNMANLLQEQGRWTEAEALFKETQQTSHRVLGPEHPQTLTAVNNLGTFYHAAGRSAEAESWLTQALDDRRRVLGDAHPHTLDSMNNVARVLQEQGKLEQAVESFKLALESAQKALPPGHPTTLVLSGNCGKCLLALERYEEAERYLLAAYEGMKAGMGAQHAWTTTTASALSDLYQAWGRPDQAAEWQAKLNDQSGPRP